MKEVVLVIFLVVLGFNKEVRQDEVYEHTIDTLATSIEDTDKVDSEVVEDLLEVQQ